MTKFEQIVINFQHNAYTKEDAKRYFDYSCTCCCMRGMRIECDRCAIACAHKHVVATFDSQDKEAV